MSLSCDSLLNLLICVACPPISSVFYQFVSWLFVHVFERIKLLHVFEGATLAKNPIVGPAAPGTNTLFGLFLKKSCALCIYDEFY